ncbi:MAG: beta-agarase, partial [Verrucomicrobiota bacterium]
MHNPLLFFPIFTALFFLSFSHANEEALLLSEEGKSKKALHDFLFETFSKDRETRFTGDGQSRGLKVLTILTETREIGHGAELELPAGTEKIAVFFRHFGFHGENLDHIKEVHVVPFSPDKAPPRSAQVTDFYRVQMPTIPETGSDPGLMKIRFLMKDESATCRIDDLVFYAQNAISPEFDRIPFLDLGSDQPREKVVIGVDIENELSIGGSTELQRERWFRYHETPGSTHSSFQRWAYEKGFLPARGFLKFNPALTKGWGKDPETLKERTDKPGAADLTFFERSDSGERLRGAIPELKDKTFSMCFNDWPDFMAVPLKGRGTPLVERFDEATELAAAYVADQIADAGYTATWWEVKNESSVKSEWDHHFAPGMDGWGLLADFHNRVADAIHAKAPEVKVGGPSSAYMQLQVKDFELFRSQARFIEETRGHLDFFSHHFYENRGMLGAYERRGSGYSNYLLGRYEAILDMLRAHMHKVDHVLPILVTETGTLQNGRRPSDNWFRLMAYNAYLNKSMQRPDQIDLFVPFIFHHMTWNPNSGDAAFTPKVGVEKGWEMKDFEPTTAARFFDLWQGFDGSRLPVSFERDWLDVTAIHNDEGIALAVTNMGGRQLALDLSRLAEKTNATEVRRKRLNYREGEVVFEAENAVDAASIPLDVNETTIIRFLLEEPLAPAGKLEMERWYSHEAGVKKTGVPVSFPVTIRDPDKVEKAKLVIGMHRFGGITEPFGVSLNGTAVDVDPGDAAEFSEFFAPLDAAVPVDLVKADNEVTVQLQEGTTITS